MSAALPAPARRQSGGCVQAVDGELSSRSDAELIARVLAGPEPSAEALRCGSALARIPPWRRRALGVGGLVSELGVPAGRAVRLAALWELAERWSPDDRPEVSCARDALLLLGDLRARSTERVVAVLLDARHRPLGVELVAHGTVNAARFQPRDVIAPALRAGAAAVIAAHNHPSGDPAPSRADRAVTLSLRDACEAVGIPLLDHLVVGRRGHFSFREVESWGGPAGPPD